MVLQYLLLSFELVVFALLHIKAYPWRPYAEGEKYGAYQGGTLGWRAFVDCWNLLDVVRSIHRGFHWMFVGRKRRNAGQQSQDELVAYNSKTGVLGTEQELQYGHYQS